MHNENEEFLVVAASCRAMARSVRQAGYRCRGIDLFADWDAQQICNVRQVRSCEAAVREATNQSTPSRILIGAGIENEVAGREDPFAGKPVYSPVGQALADVLDPFLLSDRLRAAHIPVLSISRDWLESGEWLEKPLRSGGGQHVRRMHTAANLVTGKGDSRPVYYQEYVPGVVCGATFVAGAKECELMGVCRQIPSVSSTRPFLYSGSYGPVFLSPAIERQLRGMATVIAGSCGLLGWFGIDFIVCEDVAWLLEVNPRYTASMEILERSAGYSLFHHHLNAFEPIGQAKFEPPRETALLGKEYVYWDAENPIVIDAETHANLVLLSKVAEPSLTDIPCPGTCIETDMPVCTVWADAATDAAVLGNLAMARETVLRLLKQKKTAKK